jgi:hypothetical protein
MSFQKAKLYFAHTGYPDVQHAGGHGWPRSSLPLRESTMGPFGILCRFLERYTGGL